jgi:hypothetical protein
MPEAFFAGTGKYCRATEGTEKMLSYASDLISNAYRMHPVSVQSGMLLAFNDGTTVELTTATKG